MAITALGRRLTEAHRLAQTQVSARTAKAFVSAWPLLRLEETAASFPGYADAALSIIAAGHSQSAALAAAYLRAFREAEGVKHDATFAPVVADLDRARAVQSLLLTGPAIVRARQAKGISLEIAGRDALAVSTGAVIRQTLSGGRDTVDLTVDTDPAAHGVARVTDGAPCYFCAMLAGRGPVYRSEDTARFKPHDACGCQPEPVYTTGDHYRWPTPAAKGWSALYADSTAGTSGADSVNAFRRAYEAQGRTN